MSIGHPQGKGPATRAVHVTREMHRVIGVMAAEQGLSKQDMAMKLLCEALGRPDLLPESAELAASA